MRNPWSKSISQNFADGSLAEMIEDPADATKTLLAVYDNQSVRYAESVDDRGGTLGAAFEGLMKELRHVHVSPRALEPYGQSPGSR